MKRIFEIHAPGYDAQALSEDIERDLQSAPFDADDVRRVEQLNFAPVTPAGERGFDPALTAELFEQRVVTPDFRSRKFRFIRGPLRALASALFRFLVQLNEKLSENKVQAFYHVVHELIALSHRYERLQARFGEVQEELYRLRAERGASAQSGSQLDASSDTTLPEPDPATVRANSALAMTVSEHLSAGAALALDDKWAFFAHELRATGFAAQASIADGGIVTATNAVRGPIAVAAGCLSALVAHSPGSLQLISHLHLEAPSDPPHDLPELLASRCASKGLLVLRWNSAAEGPFVVTAQCRVDLQALIEKMQSLNFETLAVRRDSPRAGSFELLLRKL